MARPLSSSSVYGRSLPVGPLLGSLFSNGLDQLLSTIGGTTVVSRPPMKKKMSAATTKPMALLSVLPSMCSPSCRLCGCLCGADFGAGQHSGHHVVKESGDSAEHQDAGEEPHGPNRLQGDDGVNERDRGIVPLPTL